MKHSTAVENFQKREADRERRAKERVHKREEYRRQVELRLEARRLQIERIRERQDRTSAVPLPKKKKEQSFSRFGKHQSALDRQNHSAIEIRYKEIYGKWPSALELQQAMPFLKRRQFDKEE